MNKPLLSKIFEIVIKILVTAAILYCSLIAALLLGFIFSADDIHMAVYYPVMLLLPSLLIPLVWLRKRWRYVKWWSVFGAVVLIALVVDYGIVRYQDSITINVTPNIPVHEYLPFRDDSNIVKVDSQTLKLEEDLPIVDGAAAVFPVYSAFVNAVYPNTTRLNDGVFEYNNTSSGYYYLGRKETDIFFGAYPSQEQIDEAKKLGTTFEYTQIGADAFVFFVHKDNPIESLTTQQVKGIYSGEITNWKEVGGNNERIAAFQRNEGSGSQSTLKRFMGDTPIMEPPTEMVNDLMSGIIEQVADYKSKSGSIGFSFRYYLEGIIKNPDIKMIAIDGVQPTVENIENGIYPIVGPLYAVTYAENDNENVDKLIAWILSEEGQSIIERTGYVRVKR